jgi:hypothetical protein
MKTKYTFTNILIILSILTVAYIYSLIYAPIIENSNDDSITTSISKMNKSCILSCPAKGCKRYIKNNRGKQYFISIPADEQKYIKSCLITFWGFTHFLMYFILTFLVPAFYLELFFIGVIFEFYEYYRFECQDINDIYLNTFGILLGKFFSPFN